MNVLPLISCQGTSLSAAKDPAAMVKLSSEMMPNNTPIFFIAFSLCPLGRTAALGRARQRYNRYGLCQAQKQVMCQHIRLLPHSLSGYSLLSRGLATELLLQSSHP